VLQARIAVVEREASVTRLVDLHFCPREAEAARVLGILPVAFRFYGQLTNQAEPHRVASRVTMR